jgi:AraC-like DNA-binding protein
MHAQGTTEVIADSLVDKSDEYLLDQYDLFMKNRKLANIYGKTYLKRTIASGDSLKISLAYYYLSFVNDFETSLKYADSALIYQENKKKFSHHATIWMQIGVLNFNNGQFSKALDSYLTAEKYALRDNQYWLFSDIDYNLGLLRIKTGEYNEAIENFKESLISLNITEEPIIYLQSLNSLAMAYFRTDQIDSAKVYNSLAVQKARAHGLTGLLHWAKITEGVIYYKIGSYDNAIDTLTKYIPYVEQIGDSSFLSFSYFYLGKSYAGNSDWDKAIPKFKKVDTILSDIDNYTLDIRENYKILYEFYKDNKEQGKQLYYLEKLIDFDSILYANNAQVSNTILKEYDTPKLINEKERLIGDLRLEGDKSKIILNILSIIAVVFVILSFYHYRQRKIYMQRFEALTSDDSKVKSSKDENKPVGEIGVPPNIVLKVLKNLKDFELEKGYLSPDISLGHLAKHVGTNSNYLSKIINHHKKVNFSSYLSSLRIDHVVAELRENQQLREYTIKAIAFEVGFRNAESFTKAFYQQNGIYPSYFIKQLKKKEK